MHNQGCQFYRHPNAEVLVPLILQIVVHHIGLSVNKETINFDNFVVYSYNLKNIQPRSQTLSSFHSLVGRKRRESLGSRFKNVFHCAKMRFDR